MSISAFPVLARILEEREIQGTTLGTTTITCAVVDDVVAWILLAVAVAFTMLAAMAPVTTICTTEILNLLGIQNGGLRKISQLRRTGAEARAKVMSPSSFLAGQRVTRQQQKSFPGHSWSRTLLLDGSQNRLLIGKNLFLIRDNFIERLLVLHDSRLVVKNGLLILQDGCLMVKDGLLIC
jgi:hypothetical protein